MDLLTLKKQMIEEIKNELQLDGGLDHKLKDPFQEM